MLAHIFSKRRRQGRNDRHSIKLKTHWILFLNYDKEYNFPTHYEFLDSNTNIHRYIEIRYIYRFIYGIVLIILVILCVFWSLYNLFFVISFLENSYMVASYD